MSLLPVAEAQTRVLALGRAAAPETKRAPQLSVGTIQRAKS